MPTRIPEAPFRSCSNVIFKTDRDYAQVATSGFAATAYPELACCELVEPAAGLSRYCLVEVFVIIQDRFINIVLHYRLRWCAGRQRWRGELRTGEKERRKEVLTL